MDTLKDTSIVSLLRYLEGAFGSRNPSSTLSDAIYSHILAAGLPAEDDETTRHDLLQRITIITFALQKANFHSEATKLEGLVNRLIFSPSNTALFPTYIPSATLSSGYSPKHPVGVAPITNPSAIITLLLSLADHGSRVALVPNTCMATDHSPHIQYLAHTNEDESGERQVRASGKGWSANIITNANDLVGAGRALSTSGIGGMCGVHSAHNAHSGAKVNRMSNIRSRSKGRRAEATLQWARAGAHTTATIITGIDTTIATADTSTAATTAASSAIAAAHDSIAYDSVAQEATGGTGSRMASVVGKGIDVSAVTAMGVSTGASTGVGMSVRCGYPRGEEIGGRRVEVDAKVRSADMSLLPRLEFTDSESIRRWGSAFSQDLLLPEVFFPKITCTDSISAAASSLPPSASACTPAAHSTLSPGSFSSLDLSILPLSLLPAPGMGQSTSIINTNDNYNLTTLTSSSGFPIPGMPPLPATQPTALPSTLPAAHTLSIPGMSSLPAPTTAPALTAASAGPSAAALLPPVPGMPPLPTAPPLQPHVPLNIDPSHSYASAATPPPSQVLHPCASRPPAHRPQYLQPALPTPHTRTCTRVPWASALHALTPTPTHAPAHARTQAHARVYSQLAASSSPSSTSARSPFCPLWRVLVHHALSAAQLCDVTVASLLAITHARTPTKITTLGNGTRGSTEPLSTASRVTNALAHGVAVNGMGLARHGRVVERGADVGEASTSALSALLPAYQPVMSALCGAPAAEAHVPLNRPANIRREGEGGEEEQKEQEEQKQHDEDEDRDARASSTPPSPWPPHRSCALPHSLALFAGLPTPLAHSLTTALHGVAHAFILAVTHACAEVGQDTDVHARIPLHTHTHARTSMYSSIYPDAYASTNAYPENVCVARAVGGVHGTYGDDRTDCDSHNIHSNVSDTITGILSRLKPYFPPHIAPEFFRVTSQMLASTLPVHAAPLPALASASTRALLPSRHSPLPPLSPSLLPRMVLSAIAVLFHGGHTPLFLPSPASCSSAAPAFPQGFLPSALLARLHAAHVYACPCTPVPRQLSTFLSTLRDVLSAAAVCQQLLQWVRRHTYLADPLPNNPRGPPTPSTTSPTSAAASSPVLAAVATVVQGVLSHIAMIARGIADGYLTLVDDTHDDVYQPDNNFYNHVAPSQISPFHSSSPPHMHRHAPASSQTNTHTHGYARMHTRTYTYACVCGHSPCILSAHTTRDTHSTHDADANVESSAGAGFGWMCEPRQREELSLSSGRCPASPSLLLFAPLLSTTHTLAHALLSTSNTTSAEPHADTTRDTTSGPALLCRLWQLAARTDTHADVHTLVMPHRTSTRASTPRSGHLHALPSPGLLLRRITTAALHAYCRALHQWMRGHRAFAPDVPLALARCGDDDGGAARTASVSTATPTSASTPHTTPVSTLPSASPHVQLTRSPAPIPLLFGPAAPLVLATQENLLLAEASATNTAATATTTATDTGTGSDNTIEAENSEHIAANSMRAALGDGVSSTTSLVTPSSHSSSPPATASPLSLPPPLLSLSLCELCHLDEHVDVDTLPPSIQHALMSTPTSPLPPPSPLPSPAPPGVHTPHMSLLQLLLHLASDPNPSSSAACLPLLLAVDLLAARLSTLLMSATAMANTQHDARQRRRTVAVAAFARSVRHRREKLRAEAAARAATQHEKMRKKQLLGIEQREHLQFKLDKQKKDAADAKQHDRDQMLENALLEQEKTRLAREEVIQTYLTEIAREDRRQRRVLWVMRRREGVESKRALLRGEMKREQAEGTRAMEAEGTARTEWQWAASGEEVGEGGGGSAAIYDVSTLPTPVNNVNTTTTTTNATRAALPPPPPASTSTTTTIDSPMAPISISFARYCHMRARLLALLPPHAPAPTPSATTTPFPTSPTLPRDPPSADPADWPLLTLPAKAALLAAAVSAWERTVRGACVSGDEEGAVVGMLGGRVRMVLDMAVAGTPADANANTDADLGANGDVRTGADSAALHHFLLSPSPSSAIRACLSQLPAPDEHEWRAYVEYRDLLRAATLRQLHMEASMHPQTATHVHAQITIATATTNSNATYTPAAATGNTSVHDAAPSPSITDSAWPSTYIPDSIFASAFVPVAGGWTSTSTSGLVAAPPFPVVAVSASPSTYTSPSALTSSPTSAAALESVSPLLSSTDITAPSASVFVCLTLSIYPSGAISLLLPVLPAAVCAEVDEYMHYCLALAQEQDERVPQVELMSLGDGMVEGGMVGVKSRDGIVSLQGESHSSIRDGDIDSYNDDKEEENVKIPAHTHPAPTLYDIVRVLQPLVLFCADSSDELSSPSSIMLMHHLRHCIDAHHQWFKALLSTNTPATRTHVLAPVRIGGATACVSDVKAADLGPAYCNANSRASIDTMCDVDAVGTIGTASVAYTGSGVYPRSQANTVDAASATDATSSNDAVGKTHADISFTSPSSLSSTHPSSIPLSLPLEAASSSVTAASIIARLPPAAAAARALFAHAALTLSLASAGAAADPTSAAVNANTAGIVDAATYAPIIAADHNGDSHCDSVSCGDIAAVDVGWSTRIACIAQLWVSSQYLLTRHAARLAFLQHRPLAHLALLRDVVLLGNNAFAATLVRMTVGSPHELPGVLFAKALEEVYDLAVLPWAHIDTYMHDADVEKHMYPTRGSPRTSSGGGATDGGPEIGSDNGRARGRSRRDAWASSLGYGSGWPYSPAEVARVGLVEEGQWGHSSGERASGSGDEGRGLRDGGDVSHLSSLSSSSTWASGPLFHAKSLPSVLNYYRHTHVRYLADWPLTLLLTPSTLHDGYTPVFRYLQKLLVAQRCLREGMVHLKATSRVLLVAAREKAGKQHDALAAAGITLETPLAGLRGRGSTGKKTASASVSTSVSVVDLMSDTMSLSTSHVSPSLAVAPEGSFAVPEAYIWWLLPRIQARAHRLLHSLHRALDAVYAHAQHGVIEPLWSAMMKEMAEAEAVEDMVKAHHKCLHTMVTHLSLAGTASAAQKPLVGLLLSAVTAVAVCKRVHVLTHALATTPFRVLSIAPQRNYEDLTLHAPPWWLLRCAGGGGEGAARGRVRGRRELDRAVMCLQQVYYPHVSLVLSSMSTASASAPSAPIAVSTPTSLTTEGLIQALKDCSLALDETYRRAMQHAQLLHHIVTALAEKGVEAMHGLAAQLCSNGFFDSA